MEGGIAFFLLLVIVIVAIVGGIALYVTGGALWSRKTSDEDAGGESRRRPLHKAPRDPAQAHTHLVGTPEGDEAMRRRRDRG